jgi:hypothetical protein
MLPAVLRPVLLVAMVAALAGCGSGGPSDDQLVAATVSAFGRATAAKDYRTLCDRLLAPSLVEKLTQVGLPCAEAMGKSLGGVRDPRLTIGQIDVQGDRATAQIRTSAAGQATSRDTLQLERVRGSWRIASLGS